MTPDYSRKFTRTAAAAALAASLAACSGGGTTIPSAGGTQTPVVSPKNATAQMIVKIPAKSAMLRTPKYISGSTQSMTIGLLSNGKTTPLAEADLTPASPNCSSITGGGTQCTVSVVMAAGQQTFVLSMYDQTGGKGKLLSTGDVAATLVANQATNVPIVLDAVPSSVSLVLGTGTLPVGNNGSTSVILQAKDADGNIIVGPGGFTTPVSLAITGDTYKTLSLSSTSIASPGQAVTLSYNGGTNVGSTITPSLGSTAGAPATFAGTGAAITELGATISVPSGYNSWMYPSSVAALGNGKVGVLYRAYKQVCCWTTTYAYPIAVGSASGLQKYYVGDTTDPFNPSNATSDFAAQSGVTVVKGMSINLLPWTNAEQEHTIAGDANGNLYYSATFSSTAANDNCGGGGGALNSGVLGVLNTATGTAKEYVLQGVPQIIQTDSNGNVWFVEKSGTCNGSALLSSGWAIGELKAGSSSPVETDFANIGGMISNPYPYAMNVTPDGSAMFIGDGNNQVMVKVDTKAMTAASIALTNSAYPYGVAASNDGTAYWLTDNSNGSNYYYGYISGSQSFATANLQEALFPAPYFYGYDAVYADGSFWGAGYDDYGLGRISGLAADKPQAAFYSLMTPYYAEPTTLSAGSGYIWANDDDEYAVLAIQYGQQSNSTETINVVHRIGTFSSVRLPSMQKMRQAQMAKRHR
jgi:hypothetical protein